MIPGDRARAYLEGITPRRERISLWPLVYSLLIVLAFILMGTSALVTETAQTREELRHLGFGFPLDFVYADKSVYSMEVPGKHWLNPWEDQIGISPGRLLVDWAFFSLIVLGPVMLIRWLLVRGRTQLGLER